MLRHALVIDGLVLTRLYDLPRTGLNKKLPTIKMSQNKLEATESLRKRDCMLNE
jgi:hypothetical protein